MTTDTRDAAHAGGVLVIDKSPGPSSHDVVAAVKKHVRVRKAGHLGTLDPFASGVLPVAVNDATKLAARMLDHDKEYDAAIKLGVATDTLDCTGTVTGEQPVPDFDNAALEEALAKFRGPIRQLTPAFSAQKVRGKKMYELARMGGPVPRPPRDVEIFELECTAREGGNVVHVRVRCSAGTYIRQLAADIGERLGTCAHLSALRRTRSGPYGLAEAMTLKRLLDTPAAEVWTRLLAA